MSDSRTSIDVQSATASAIAVTLTGYSRSPKLLRGGLVVQDPISGTTTGVIVLQYNPDTITRTFQPRGIAAEPGDRLEAHRLVGPPHQTIKLEAELDAVDQLEHPDFPANNAVVTYGLLPAIATLEALVTPTVTALLETDSLFDRGSLEVAPTEGPLTLFVWSVDRVIPVRVTQLTITEEAFNPALHPIRAKVSLELAVLTTSDVGIRTRSGALYMQHRTKTEELAKMASTTDVAPLGLHGGP
jgi:hypothetical protein